MQILLIVTWLVLLFSGLALPFVRELADPGDLVTRHTIRLSLAYYALAFNLMCLFPNSDTWRRRARTCWTIAWATYVVHVAFAFHFFHEWSHGKAVEHVEKTSGYGEGIFLSYLFTFIWTIDVASWWLAREGLVDRARWLTGLLHVFMLFVTFNATVVFGQGPVRWIGLAVCIELALVGLYWWRKEPPLDL